MIYVYALCPAAALPPPARRGLGGARLDAVRRDGLAAVVSRHRTLRARPSRAQVLAHERIVEAQMERGPVLPLRFGTQLDEQHLAAYLDERRDELLAALARVRGRVELAVRMLPADAEAGSSAGAGPDAGADADPAAGDAGRAASGRAYLLARAARQRRRDRAVDAVHGPLAALAHDAVVRELPPEPALLVAAYLVDRDRVPAFRDRVAALDAAQPGAHIVLTGPLPPYSFTAESVRDRAR